MLPVSQGRNLKGAEVYCPNTAAGGHLWGQGLDLRDRRGRGGAPNVLFSFSDVGKGSESLSNLPKIS